MRDENFERAVNELRTHQQQLDEDGIVVGVSREALTDVLNEIEALTGDFNDNVDRLKACEHIADGDEGWEKLRNECPSTAAVARLQDRAAQLREALAFTLEQLRELMVFHDSKTKPCGEYGVECPISMGEWFGESERAGIEASRAVLASVPER